MGVILMLVLSMALIIFWFYKAMLDLPEIAAISLLAVALSAAILGISYSVSEESTEMYVSLREEVKKCNQILEVYDLAIANVMKGSKAHLRLTAEKDGILEERDKYSKDMQEIMVAKIRHRTSFMFGIFIDIPKPER
jgi:hypothetical protein